jgi:3-hydroxybutyryl-CoA dehydrogenase
VEAAERFASEIGKHPIRTKDRSGFIVNMLLVPYLMAAVRMYEDGFASREDIDEGMRLGCGHPMGPLALCDLIGLDVLYAVCDSLFEEFKRPEYAPPPLLKRLVVAGHHGRKTGRGFYEYTAAGRPTNTAAGRPTTAVAQRAAKAEDPSNGPRPTPSVSAPG